MHIAQTNSKTEAGNTAASFCIVYHFRFWLSTLELFIGFFSSKHDALKVRGTHGRG